MLGPDVWKKWFDSLPVSRRRLNAVDASVQSTASKQRRDDSNLRVRASKLRTELTATKKELARTRVELRQERRQSLTRSKDLMRVCNEIVDALNAWGARQQRFEEQVTGAFRQHLPNAAEDIEAANKATERGDKV